MKYTRTAALAALGLAATLSLTACGGNDDSAAGASAKSPASTAAPATPSSDAATTDGGGATSGGGGKSGGDKGGSSAGKNTAAGTGASGGSAGGGKSGSCTTQDLAIDARYAAAGPTEGRINVTMVNRGSTTCSATGFAGVDIKDADHTSNPIERGPAQPRVTSLKPGESAVFDLAYTVDPSGKSLAHPTNLLVTPPNETHTVSLKWPAGAGAIKGAYTDVQVYPTHTAE
ncbi:DUF4232 domain-containing protein [Streptomyces sp. NPDC048111]|uniref:DUF4232 domain-containing protein n=1 Tax=Streptomyces sp. NPDC048111 TaxID=3365500 RepID=UPI00371135A7